MEILQLEIAIREIKKKNSMHRLKSRIWKTEERIREFETSIENPQSEQHTENRLKNKMNKT